MDLDWEGVKAVDIYAALRSFLPAGGRIESVTVYPSDYGLQRMKEETTRGPQVRHRHAFSCSRCADLISHRQCFRPVD